MSRAWWADEGSVSLTSANATLCPAVNEIRDHDYETSLKTRGRRGAPDISAVGDAKHKRKAHHHGEVGRARHRNRHARQSQP